MFSGTIHLSGKGQRHEISQLLVNEKYDPDNEWKNDVCLIQIQDKFQYDENTQQITLPTQGWPVEDGDLLTITGWGYTDPVSSSGFGFDMVVIVFFSSLVRSSHTRQAASRE